MAELEQLASAHDAMVLLLSKMPHAALTRIMCAAAGIELHDHDDIRERSPAFEVPGLNRRARKGLIDLLLTVRTRDGAVLMHWILEVQLCWDVEKLWSWSLYSAAVGAETKKPAVVAAFVPDPALRARIRRMIPKILPPPKLVEPDHLELIDDIQQAHRQPHEAVLGAVFHALGAGPVEQRVAGIRAAFLAAQRLDPLECRSYTVLMLTLTPADIAQRALDEMRERGEYNESRYITFEEYEISPVERGSYLYEKAHRIGRRDGVQEGREHGQIQLLHRTIVDILELRGFTVTAAHRARVESCEDLEALERWYAAARTLPTDAALDQLFE
ncbi:hypothetical protein [Enhygromyxa salina]|nr:hypothetical protein [Enhygromyxa salina]